MALREREDDGRVGTSWRQTQTWMDNGSVRVDQGYPQSHTGPWVIMSDETHANYLKRKARGEIIMGDMELTKWNRTMTAGSVGGSVATWTPPHGESWSYTGDYAYTFENMVAASLVSPLADDLAKMREMALIKAYSKLNASDICSLEIITDLDKTVKMLHRPFSGVQDLLVKANNKRLKLLGKTVQSATRAAANAWLEYRLGMRPFLLDIDTIIESSHAIKNRVEARRRVARSAVMQEYNTSKSLANEPMTGFFYSTNNYWRCSGMAMLKEKASAHGGVIYDIKDRNTVDRLQAMLGTRPQDLPNSIWQTIPYSFVVDRFVNVGDWLSAITPNPFVDVRAHWVTTKHNRYIQYIIPVVTYQTQVYPAPLWTGSGGNSSTDSTWVVRQIHPEIANLPALVTRSPRVLQSVDGLALAVKPILALLSKFKGAK